MSEGTKGNGLGIRWVRDHSNYPHKDWCLIWPFSTNRGYGMFGYLRKKYYAHRFMCELVHGAPPSEVHEAAHSCGDEGCVNPHHISWKTPSENCADCLKHGTHIKSRYGGAGKITAEQAETIRGLRGIKTLLQIAEEYGISESAVSNIWVGRTHHRVRKIDPWTPEEDDKLRAGIASGMSLGQLAKMFPNRGKGIYNRSMRLGLKSVFSKGNGNGGATNG